MAEIEICCGSAMDAVEAWKGGAKRVELNADLFHGGLTPSVGTLQTVKQYAHDLKVMCMLRPREGGFAYNEVEFHAMLYDARELLESGADGIVLGILHENGTVDQDRCGQLVDLTHSYKKECVFHRAIDVVPDIELSMRQLITLGFDRVLTSGRAKTALEGKEVILRLIRLADEQIEILPGSGIKPHNVVEAVHTFPVPYLHGSLRSVRKDGSTLANPEINFSGDMASGELYMGTQADEVRAFLDAARSCDEYHTV